MPFRSKATLERWLAEYTETGRGPVGGFEVLAQDGYDGADTGLMVVRLRHATTEVYMQPVAPGDPHWEVAFGPRPSELSLDTEGLLGLANELVAAAALCIFLERKSQNHIDTH